MDSRSLAQQDRAEQARRRQKVSRVVMLLVALLLSGSAIALLVADQLLRPDAFVIDQLKLKGRFAHLSPSEVEQTVVQYKSGNFFSVNLDEIQHQLEQLRWVDKAEVRREWPDTLLVSITEHQPIMRMNENAWVNIRGQVVDLPEYASQAPVITLNGEPEQAKLMMVNALLWSKRLDEYALALREVNLSKSGAWSLRVRYMDDTNEQPDEFMLLLGDEALDERLVRFEQLFDRRFRFSPERLVSADARYPDGIAVKTKSKTNDLSDSGVQMLSGYWIAAVGVTRPSATEFSVIHSYARYSAVRQLDGAKP